MKVKRHAKNATGSLVDAATQILVGGAVSDQNQLVKLLSNAGFTTSQANVSRLLRKLNVIRTRNSAGKMIYALPKEALAPPKESMMSLIVGITANDNLIVVHTDPGSASLVARFLDYKKEELGILGTIAGDDTVFIAPVASKKIAKLLLAVKQLLYSE